MNQRPLTGPIPEIMAPIAPTPWRADENFVRDATGKTLFLFSGDDMTPDEDVRAAEYIVRLVNRDNPYMTPTEGGAPELRTITTEFAGPRSRAPQPAFEVSPGYFWFADTRDQAEAELRGLTGTNGWKLQASDFPVLVHGTNTVFETIGDWNAQ